MRGWPNTVKSWLPGCSLSRPRHARVHVRADVRHVDPQLRVLGLLDHGLGGAVEAEAGDDEIVVAAP